MCIGYGHLFCSVFSGAYYSAHRSRAARPMALKISSMYRTSDQATHVQIYSCILTIVLLFICYGLNYILECLLCARWCAKQLPLPFVYFSLSKCIMKLQFTKLVKKAMFSQKILPKIMQFNGLHTLEYYRAIVFLIGIFY